MVTLMIITFHEAFDLALKVTGTENVLDEPYLPGYIPKLLKPY